MEAPKAWWSGDARVEPFMPPVHAEIAKHNLPREAQTAIYNRAYEAVYAAIQLYAAPAVKEEQKNE